MAGTNRFSGFAELDLSSLSLSHFKYPSDPPSRHLCNKQCHEASIKINMINNSKGMGITSRHVTDW